MTSVNIFNESIARQQELLYRELTKLLERGTKVALLDYPNHNNVGDNAIWLGEKAALRSIGVEVVYQCDLYSYSEQAVRRKLEKGGTILLHGGGNFGTVWPHHQKFREDIIQSFPEMKIIQLPQSVHFADGESLNRFVEIAKGHRNLHLFVRDRKSYDILKDLEGYTYLCPDMAFALGPVNSTIKPVTDLLWLSRTDHESVGEQDERINATVEKVDWIFGEPSRAYSKYTMRFTVRIRVLTQKAFRKSKFLRDNVWMVNTFFFDFLARRRFQRGIRTLGRGKVVITDRLHGHIVSTLLGKRQVLLDNSYKKIGNYIECFSPSVRGNGVTYLGDKVQDVPRAAEKALLDYEDASENGR